MSLIPPSEGQPPAGTEPPASEGTPPAGSEGTPPAVERPDWLPEALWGDAGFNSDAFAALAARPEPQEGVPESPDGYQLPAIEGFDPEAAAASPLFTALRKHAHANGMGQAAFEATINDYVAGETARAEAYEAEQRTALGPDATTRLKTLGTWLDSSLPADQAAAVRAMATDAAAVAGLEALMNQRAGAKPRTPPPPAESADTDETIRTLMASKAYRGKPNERDPAVVARVDAYFAKKHAAKPA